MRGPRVVRPRRKGFGRMIIDRETKEALRRRITIVYAPTGLRAHLSIPLAKDRESDD